MKSSNLQKSTVEEKELFFERYDPYTLLEFPVIQAQADRFADAIEANFEKLVSILLRYESHEVATDEIGRTLDLLRNLKENKDYFKIRAGEVVAFLPRNQPLYAFSCFVVVPSLMASEVHFRIPHSMRGFFPDMLELLGVFGFFPNILVSSKERLDFLRDRTALLINPKTGQSRPVTDAVIFTGTPDHASQLRLIFDKRILFITNGAGHNPIVISENADMSKAVGAVLILGLYNQGQDCAAPNSILVHQNVYKEFLKRLHIELAKVKIGPYHDRSCRVGPISDYEDLKRVEAILVDNFEYLDPVAGGIIHTAKAIVEPTIICKPLGDGGNYSEIFAPIFFVQEYTQDGELEEYFENQRYALNAMYVMLYGDSFYIKSLIDRPIGKKILLDEYTFLHNTHLHVQGVERGTQPYGGYGRSASNISINGKIIAKPTLPQRDIFEYVAKPIISKKSLKTFKSNVHKFTEIQYKDVERLLRLRLPVTNNGNLKKTVEFGDNAYFDIDLTEANGQRYVKINNKNTYCLLSKPNLKYIAKLKPEDVQHVRAVKTLLGKKERMEPEEFATMLYIISKGHNESNQYNNDKQPPFFKHIYQLLFGKDLGPRLGPFLWQVDPKKICELLYV